MFAPVYIYKDYGCLKVECNHSSNYISRLWGQLGILINVDLATHLPQNVSK